MMITNRERRRALSALDWIESRPSCASGPITSSVNSPTLAIRSPLSASRASDLLPSLILRAGSAWFATLCLTSHGIQSP
jgi:hypothetical protein